MIYRLFDQNGKLVHEGKMDKNERPDAVIWKEFELFVADPFSHSATDRWWRYSAATVHLAPREDS